MTTNYLSFDTVPTLYPLDEKIIVDTEIAMFESEKAHFKDNSSDAIFLKSLAKVNVYSGAAECRLYPFIAFPDLPVSKLLPAKEILSVLKASCFESEHIQDLDAINIPFSGYHPLTKNDEIHTDAKKQYILANFEKAPEHPSFKLHEDLRDFVLDQHLYYVLIHTKPEFEGELSHYVILFAVGVSPKTGNIVGVVGHQVCHNLCD